MDVQIDKARSDIAVARVRHSPPCHRRQPD
jgi:hypothetical protein